MDITAILIGLALGAAVALYVLQPLVRRQRRVIDPRGETRRETLEAEYRAALDAIRDLDFDFQTGKVLQKDYGVLREKYAAQGAALLKELDQLGGRVRKERAAGTGADEIEAMIRARRKTAATQACPICGQPFLPGDRFCAKCGASLEAKT